MATVGDVAINPALFKEMPYKWDDFAPISAISDAPMVWATNANTPYKSIADVLAAAKAQPGRLSVGSPGNGSINQIVMEWMALNTGTQFQHIPYKGGAPAAAALAGGDIPFGVLASSSVAPQVKAGRLRVLAVTGAQPSKFNPEWPTLQSQGVKDVDASNWTLLLAPKGTPKEIVDKLQAEVVKILAMPDVKERFAGGGVETIPSTGGRARRQGQEDRAAVARDRREGEDQAGLTLRIRGGATGRRRCAFARRRISGPGCSSSPLRRASSGCRTNTALGTMHRMGPGLFPTLVGVLLAGLGLIIAARAFAIDGPPVPRFHARPDPRQPRSPSRCSAWRWRISG